MKVDVVLLHRFSAFVQLVKRLSVFSREFSGSKGMRGLLVRNDAVDVIPLACVGLGVLLFDEIQLCPVCSAALGRPPVDRNVSLLGDFFDMRVELVGQHTHDS